MPCLMRDSSFYSWLLPLLNVYILILGMGPVYHSIYSLENPVNTWVAAFTQICFFHSHYVWVRSWTVLITAALLALLLSHHIPSVWFSSKHDGVCECNTAKQPQNLSPAWTLSNRRWLSVLVAKHAGTVIQNSHCKQMDPCKLGVVLPATWLHP